MYHEQKINRNDIFLTSKLWNTFHLPEHVEFGCSRTLKVILQQQLDRWTQLVHFLGSECGLH